MQEKQADTRYIKKPLTEEQQKILNIDLTSSKNIILIEALAGTGKTTTLLELARINPDKKFMYISYMSKSTGEVRSKVREEGINNIIPKTFHAMARGKVLRQLNIESRKLKKDVDLTRIILPNLKNRQAYERSRLFKEFCESGADMSSFCNSRLEEQRAKKGPAAKVNAAELERILLDVRRIWEELCDPNCAILSYQFYVKYFIENMAGLDFSEFDVLLADEAQDLSAVMHRYVMHVISLNKPVVVVGDSNQSIMGFAKSKSILSYLQNKYPERTESYPLTNSFRFEKGSDMEAAANKILRLRGKALQGAARQTPDKEDTAYIGRTNKSVLQMCFDLLSEGIKYDLFKGIEYFRNRSAELEDIYHIHNRDLGNIRSSHLRGFSAIDGLKLFAEENEDIELMSNITLVLFIIEKGLTVGGFFDLIESGIDTESHIKAGTIHTAKGMGFYKVHILSSEMFKKEDIIGIKEMAGVINIASRDLYEELNILYVAVTRAKKEMHIDAPEYKKWLDFLEKIYVWKSAGNSGDFFYGSSTMPKVVADEYIRRLREPGSNSPRKSKPTDTKQRQNNAAPEAKTKRDPIRMPFVGNVTCAVCNTGYENSSWDKCPRCGARDKKPCSS